MPFFRRFPRYAGTAIASLALLDITSWYAHWRPILQMVPNSAPMQYNTALCFVLLGGGLVLLTTPRGGVATWAGGCAALLALVSLVQYVGPWDFGIDQLFLTPFFEADTVYPGRMSPLSGFCLVFGGAAVVLVGSPKPWVRRFTAAGMLACVVGVIAAVALVGFAIGANAAYSWGYYSGMALSTSAALLLLAGGLLVLSLQGARRENSSFVRWLPATASATLMAMIAFVSGVNVAKLGTAVYWRKHTIQVILRAQEFQDSLIELQRGSRGYVTRGDPKALAAFKGGLELEARQFGGLVDLTADNPVQQASLRDLATATQNVIAYDRGEVALFARQGAAAVRALDANGRNQALFATALHCLKAFSLEEQRLLDVRDGLERRDAQIERSLLIISSVLAAVLLLVANFVVVREMAVRRRAEVEREKLIVELRAALEEVHVLSGMIPICGWCKNVRSDKGYWQSVEQYVLAHTEATFTHGICPECAAKFKAGEYPDSPGA